MSHEIQPGQGVAVFALPMPVSAFPLITEAIERIYGTGESMMRFEGDSIQINAPAEGFGPVKRSRKKAMPPADPEEGRVVYQKVRDGKVEVTFEQAQDTVLRISETVRLWFEQIGGTNYVEMKLQDRETKAEFIYTVQHASGKSPHTLRQEAETRLDDVQAYLAKTLSNIEEIDSPWTADEVREFITDALKIGGVE